VEAVDKGERYRNDEASDGEGVKGVGAARGAVAPVELGIDVLGDGIGRRATRPKEGAKKSAASGKSNTSGAKARLIFSRCGPTKQLAEKLLLRGKSSLSG
jgi:hypothetical protein